MCVCVCGCLQLKLMHIFTDTDIISDSLPISIELNMISVFIMSEQSGKQKKLCIHGKNQKLITFRMVCRYINRKKKWKRKKSSLVVQKTVRLEELKLKMVRSASGTFEFKFIQKSVPFGFGIFLFQHDYFT